jgi:hypothetical protein
MTFRCVAILALWTLLSGPVFAGLWAKPSPPARPAKTIVVAPHK